MKLVTFETEGYRSIGVHLGSRIVDLNEAVGGHGRQMSMLELLASGDAGLKRAREVAQTADEAARDAGEVQLLAPIPRPGKIVCLGMNYRDHAIETGKDVPSEPVVFCKASSSVIACNQSIRVPRVTDEVDYEVELGVVIGRRGKHVPTERALDHVAGYTVINDVSGREYQNRKPGGQWFLGKSFDTFCPMGPWIVTADEVPAPHDLDIRCRLNGDVVQESNTEHLIFKISEIIAYVSQVMTLEPGDVIATGTPHGVGMARKPPLWLRPGDVVQCEIDGVGVLENPVEVEAE